MRTYTSILATAEHLPVTDVKQIKVWNTSLGLFLNGKAIGKADLVKVTRKIVHTAGTEIYKRYRRKGHGIQLYIALVEAARSIGATRIRSDMSLNKYSRRMWQEKLAKIYPVKTRKTEQPCWRCGHKPGWKYFYIDLEKIK